MIIVKLDKERILKYTRKQLKMIEQSFGKNISKIDFNDLGIDEMTKFIFYGLKHEDESLTLEQCENIIDEYGVFGDLVESALKAFTVGIAGKKALENDSKNE